MMLFKANHATSLPYVYKVLIVFHVVLVWVWKWIKPSLKEMKTNEILVFKIHYISSSLQLKVYLGLTELPTKHCLCEVHKIPCRFQFMVVSINKTPSTCAFFNSFHWLINFCISLYIAIKSIFIWQTTNFLRSLASEANNGIYISSNCSYTH